MDEADVSQARMEAEEEFRRKYRFVVEGPKATGECLDCGEPVPPGHRWCDVYCRNSYQARTGLE